MVNKPEYASNAWHTEKINAQQATTMLLWRKGQIESDQETIFQISRSYIELNDKSTQQQKETEQSANDCLTGLKVFKSSLKHWL